MDSTLFRVDKFAVPALARGEFLNRVYATHALLRTQTGFLRDAQTSGPAEFNFITIVEWEVTRRSSRRDRLSRPCIDK
jgi:hypothetical protein